MTPIASIFNLCLSSGLIPNSWKSAIILLLLKGVLPMPPQGDLIQLSPSCEGLSPPRLATLWTIATGVSGFTTRITNITAVHCLLTVVSLDGSAVVCSFLLHEQLDIIPLDEQLFSGSPNAISLKTVWRERPVLQPHSLPLWHG